MERRTIRDGGLRGLTDAVLQWWNWRLAVRLVAVLLVPVIAVIALGAWLIGSELNRADSYARADSLVSVEVSLQALLNNVQDERTLAAQLLGDTGTGGQGLPEQARKVEAAAAETERTVALSHNPDIAALYSDVTKQLASLQPLRQAVSDGTTDAVAAQQQYTAVVDGLLRFDYILVSQVGDSELSSTANAIRNLTLAQDQVTLEHAIVAAGIGRGHLLPDEIRTLESSDVRRNDRVADFRSVADERQLRAYEQVVAGPDAEARPGLLLTVLDQATGAPPRRGPAIRVDAAQWNTASASVTGMYRELRSAELNRLRATSAGLQDASSNLAGTEAVVLVSLLAIAATVVTLIGRNLVTSLGTLRRTALEVANERLPASVASIRDGRTTAEGIEAVPINTTEEIGQLARAVDTLQGEAVRLAVEQAGLRENLNTAFVNVSRRSQSMVEHLLQELEQLERNEEDPDQLASLFKLDHLATRMRRNNENLVVLSGSNLTRRFGRPLPLSDVIRAAVSEIEQFDRVVIRPAATVRVAGYAAGDLIRLLAELLDNAGAYSSPDTQVTVLSRRERDDRLVVEVADEGIGMRPADLADANRRLAEETMLDTALSRQMGLFVVGRLARKHGIQVQLVPRENGTSAMISVPEAVLDWRSEPTAEPAAEAPPARRAAPPSRGPALAQQQSNLARLAGEFPQWPADDPGASRAPQIPANHPESLPPAGSSAADLFTPAVEPSAEEFQWPDFPDAPPESNGHNGRTGTRGPAAGWFDDAPPFEDDPGIPEQGGFPPGPAWPSTTDTPRTGNSQTSAGLPKRDPRANLVAGSAQPARPSGPVNRDPDKIRSRVNGFRAGSSDGNDATPDRAPRSSGQEGRPR